MIRGSTRPLSEVYTARNTMKDAMVTLDDNSREISMQREEIRRLRDQVRHLSNFSAKVTPENSKELAALSKDSIPV